MILRRRRARAAPVTGSPGPASHFLTVPELWRSIQRARCRALQRFRTRGPEDPALLPKNYVTLDRSFALSANMQNRGRNTSLKHFRKAVRLRIMAVLCKLQSAR